MQTEGCIHRSSKLATSSDQTESIMAAANALLSSMQKSFAASLSGGAKAAGILESQSSDT
eukprot:513151-Hanusia_phi.AAC.2